MSGIDVASFQAGIDWGAVAESDAFAIAKATEGVGFTDSEWARNSAALAAPGSLVPGAYHFGRPDLGNTAEAEADYFSGIISAFVGAARTQPTGVLLWLDLETGSGDLSGWRDAFCARVQANFGLPCGWYSFWDFILAHGLNAPTPFRAWLAWPDANGPLPTAAFQVAFQQFGQGPQGGVTCDLDRFFGDQGQLLALAAGGPLMALTDAQQQQLFDDAQYIRGWIDQNGDPLLRDIQAATEKGTNAAGTTTIIGQVLTAVQTPPTVDINALATALAPHLQVVDVAKLEADLKAALPPATAAATLAAITAQLNKP